MSNGIIIVGGFSGFTFRTSTTSSSSTITIPSSAKSGDLAVLVDFAGNNFGGAIVTKVIPSGFTEVTGLSRNQTTSRPNAVYVSYRILDSDDPGDTITGMNETGERKIMLVFSGNISSVAFTDVDSQITDSDPSSDFVSAASSTVPAIVLGIASNYTTAISFTTASPSFDAQITTSAGELRVGYKIYNSSPSNHSIDTGDFGWGNYLGTCYIKGS